MPVLVDLLSADARNRVPSKGLNSLRGVQGPLSGWRHNGQRRTGGLPGQPRRTPNIPVLVPGAAQVIGVLKRCAAASGKAFP